MGVDGQTRTGVEIHASGEFVSKRMTTDEWRRLQRVLEMTHLRGVSESESPSFIPAVFGVQSTDDPGWVMVYIENAGERHLETVPEAVPRALELLRQIWALDMNEGWLTRSSEQAPHIHAPICLQTLQAGIQATFRVDTVAAALRCTKAQRQMLAEAVEVALVIQTEADRLVPAHGDYHPRNILVRQGPGPEGQLLVIDWEYAGQHSVYRDIYALIDMCYPDATACLTMAAADRLRLAALVQAQQFHGLNPATLHAGYETFALLERLVECQQIGSDIQSGRRERVGLDAQATYVLYDLERRLRRVSPSNC